jgi:hypothetical protein
MRELKYLYPSLRFGLPLFLLLVCLPGASQATAQTFTTREGHKIEVLLRPYKDTVMLAEPTYLSFEVKNYSSEDLCLIEGGDYRNALGRPDNFKVKVVRDDGKAVPQPEIKFNLGGLVGCARLPAGRSYVKKLFLPHWATFEATGSYLISVGKSLTVKNYSTDSTSIFEAEVSAGIKVVPTDKERLGEVINGLGNIMLDIDDPESGDAALALVYIDDHRVIKYFAQALEKFSRAPDGTDEYFRSRQAAAALSQFNDDLALAALEAAMKSPVEDTRLDVASALERSEHPRSLELLLKMRDDDYWFVRLRVAQGLRRMETDESLAHLRRLLKDENEEVRKAAQAALTERARK